MPAADYTGKRIDRLAGEIDRLEKTLGVQAEMIADLRSAHMQTVTALRNLAGPGAPDVALLLADLDAKRGP